jgi:hypothetical protein
MQEEDTKMSDEMKLKQCPCGSTGEQVINAIDKVRVGWYCPQCRAFDKAIGRERKL